MTLVLCHHSFAMKCKSNHFCCIKVMVVHLCSMIRRRSISLQGPCSHTAYAEAESGSKSIQAFLQISLYDVNTMYPTKKERTHSDTDFPLTSAVISSKKLELGHPVQNHWFIGTFGREP